jgi:hypothetical protein
MSLAPGSKVGVYSVIGRACAALWPHIELPMGLWVALAPRHLLQELAEGHLVELGRRDVDRRGGNFGSGKSRDRPDASESAAAQEFPPYPSSLAA